MYVYARTYVGTRNIHTKYTMYVCTNAQWNLLNAKLYGQFHNSMLKAIPVYSTHIMYMYIHTSVENVGT